MIARLAARMIRETDPRLLAKFAYTFGWKGMRAVQRFERRLARGEFFPAFMFLSITNACNLSCQGCWVTPSQPPKSLDIDLLDRIVEACNRHGGYFFGLLGGEPLMYPRLFEFIGRHPSSYFLLFTNGTLLTDEVAAELRRLGNVSPLLSVEGSARVSDERRGGERVFARTMGGLEACVRQGLVTGVATSVCGSNIDDLATRAFVDELIARRVQYLWYYIYRPVGAASTPELALSGEQIRRLRRFIVDVRCEVPMMIVDAYWDHDGQALCPAAVGMAHHVSPDGYVEPCPPIQFAGDRLEAGASVEDIERVLASSDFLAGFRRLAGEASRGCILMEAPGALRRFVAARAAIDSSGRDAAADELSRMCVCPSHDMAGAAIPEKHWVYRFAKKHWFFGFGAYG